MRPYYKIFIPQPCDERWNDMIPDYNGRFCNSCKKTVIDFTKLSAMEVQDFLTKNQDQSICGRFKKAQLDGFNLLIPAKIIRKQYSFTLLSG